MVGFTWKTTNHSDNSRHGTPIGVFKTPKPNRSVCLAECPYEGKKRRHLLVPWAPAERIRQLVVISSRGEKRSHCRRVKGNLNVFKMTKYNKLTTGLWWETGEREPNIHGNPSTGYWRSWDLWINSHTFMSVFFFNCHLLQSGYCSCFFFSLVNCQSPLRVLRQHLTS